MTRRQKRKRAEQRLADLPRRQRQMELDPNSNVNKLLASVYEQAGWVWDPVTQSGKPK